MELWPHCFVAYCCSNNNLRGADVETTPRLTSKASQPLWFSDPILYSIILEQIADFSALFMKHISNQFYFWTSVPRQLFTYCLYSHLHGWCLFVQYGSLAIQNTCHNGRRWVKFVFIILTHGLCWLTFIPKLDKRFWPPRIHIFFFNFNSYQKLYGTQVIAANINTNSYENTRKVKEDSVSKESTYDNRIRGPNLHSNDSTRSHTAEYSVLQKMNANTNFDYNVLILWK